MSEHNEIMVSVNMGTYNQAKYIRQAIESVLMQKVNFKYEIVIGDDASTDGTREIVMEYAEKYPDIIVPLCQKKNVGIVKNGLCRKRHLSGKYIATLEGDDFWTDENKLQTQIDFLETHPEYSLCFTDSDVIKDTTRVIPYVHRDINSIKEYLNNGKGLLDIPTATLVFRNIYREDPAVLRYFTKNKLIGDRIVHTLLLQYGKFKYLPIKSATYRFITKKGNSFSSMSEYTRWEDTIQCFKVCMCITPKKYYNLWYKNIAIIYHYLLKAINQEKGSVEVAKRVLFHMNIIEKYYLLRELMRTNTTY